MRWIQATMGVLLPLPLVLLLGGLLQPKVYPEVSAGSRISPMLDSEQRERLMTYRRLCEQHSDCEPPLGCFWEGRIGRSYCTDSQCTLDAQCPEGQLCQTLATDEPGPLVRFCVALGVRQEGEGCTNVPGDKEHACAPGLVCGGLRGWCARTCRPGAAADCPEGFFCAAATPEPVCLPTCEARGCPAGQSCVQFEEGISVCGHVYGPNCQQSPCPEGRECEAHRASPHPDKVWMECVVRCDDESAPSCEAGLVCDGWHCIPGCDPQGPNVCAEGYYCDRRGEGRPFACQPDYWRDWAFWLFGRMSG